MKISEFEWDAGNILHITLGHGIEPEKAEEVFAVAPIYRKTKRGHYAAFGRAASGRLLVIVFENKGGGVVRIITGWDMDDAERRYYMRKGKGSVMKKGGTRIQEDPAEYYAKHGVLEEIEDKPIEFALDSELRKQIIEGKRLRRLQNISIKLDSAQILALKKLATMKSIPYQTLIRQWLAEGIRKELHLGSK
jgi:uncharacterized DUF497 family protein/predicted DNA binding CopG/RHH family protein